METSALYKTDPNSSFIDSVAEFLLQRFPSNLDTVKVILPNGSACIALQRSIVIKTGATFLPRILPLNNLSSDSQDIFSMPSESITQISPLEERLLLAEIIYHFRQIKLNLPQSIAFSSSLAKLFHEMLLNKTDISLLTEIPFLNQAEHWQSINNFLKYAQNAWLEQIKNIRKVPSSIYQINVLDLEINRLQRGNHTVIAGVIGHDRISRDFMKAVYSSGNGVIILPPMPELNDGIINSVIPKTHPLYLITETLKAMKVRWDSIKSLTVLNDQAINFDYLLLDQENKREFSNIEYAEYDDIFVESTAVAAFCNDYMANNPHIKVAIIINDHNIKDFYINALNKYSIVFEDRLGNSLSRTQEWAFVLSISKVLFSQFDIRSLFVVLKNPLVYDTDKYKQLILALEALLLKHNRFIDGFKEILDLVVAHHSEVSELYDFCKGLSKIFGVKCDDFALSTLLIQVINTMEFLCPKIWDSLTGKALAQLFIELTNINHKFSVVNPEELPDILKSIVYGIKIKDSEAANVVISNADDAMLCKFDLVIIPNCNDESWPKAPAANAWMNKQMQDILELNSESARYAESLYQFYLLVQNTKVLITRAKRLVSGKESMPSNYVLKLGCKLKSHFKDHVNALGDKIVNHGYVYSHVFPTSLSASDIELLIRNPYGFYAKKILKLKKLDHLGDPPKLSEFGSIIHKIIEIYTKRYAQDILDKADTFINISTEIIEASKFPIYTKSTWMKKVNAIAKDFVAFDETRRDIANIYSEVKGSTNIEVLGQSITITAIADRIEISKNSAATIIDYKTGAIPTNIDVASGLSPQLLISSIILLDGGFGLDLCVNSIQEIMYVKIGSSYPYIQIKKIPIERDEIQEHKMGLIKLLEYYVENRIFDLELDLLKYNDFKALARML